MQLRPICKAFYVYDFKDLKTIQGTPVKDLRDFVQINGDDFEEDREVRYPLSCFLELISNPATSNRLKTSIEQHSLWKEDTLTIETPSEVIEDEKLSMKAFPMEALPQDMQDYIHEIWRIFPVER